MSVESESETSGNIGLRGTGLDRTLLPTSDYFGFFQLIGQVGNTTHELTMITGTLGACRNEVRERTAAKEHGIRNARIATINYDSGAHIGVETLIVFVGHAVVIAVRSGAVLDVVHCPIIVRRSFDGNAINAIEVYEAVETVLLGKVLKLRHLEASKGFALIHQTRNPVPKPATRPGAFRPGLLAPVLVGQDEHGEAEELYLRALAMRRSSRGMS